MGGIGKTSLARACYNGPCLVNHFDTRACRKVFAKESSPPELEKVAMEMVFRCQGLPLAIVTVAGLSLRSARH
ncbi:hypothetical protein HAX54_045026 [Datura stramonium]|uniref:NB-ARC domain-containing protein n=1 Tax=Datura stramonium TaxID=4076 RepID=A0ABS8SRE3_DATST|nr:hypothetical protein [Datura stramonium]